MYLSKHTTTIPCSYQNFVAFWMVWTREAMPNTFLFNRLSEAEKNGEKIKTSGNRRSKLNKTRGYWRIVEKTREKHNVNWRRVTKKMTKLPWTERKIWSLIFLNCDRCEMRGERQRERQPEARSEGRGNADNGGERLLNHGTKKMSIECDMYDDDDDGNEKQQSFSHNE